MASRSMRPAPSPYASFPACWTSGPRPANSRATRCFSCAGRGACAIIRIGILLGLRIGYFLHQRKEWTMTGTPPTLPATPAPTGGKRALLIGIDAYTSVRPLAGCVNDILEIREFLIKKLG